MLRLIAILKGYTPLHLAAQFGRQDCYDVLIKTYSKLWSIYKNVMVFMFVLNPNYMYINFTLKMRTPIIGIIVERNLCNTLSVKMHPYQWILSKVSISVKPLLPLLYLLVVADTTQPLLIFLTIILHDCLLTCTLHCLLAILI